jgi:hypothetical protein
MLAAMNQVWNAGCNQSSVECWLQSIKRGMLAESIKRGMLAAINQVPSGGLDVQVIA